MWSSPSPPPSSSSETPPPASAPKSSISAVEAKNRALPLFLVAPRNLLTQDLLDLAQILEAIDSRFTILALKSSVSAL
eukprot:11183125-Lingulodinium_polyedra.AAC.1